tara:strand:+ start:339 stop:1490 length:1152 start_codon:yes stop_codon:yes gene_type:complete
MILGIDAFNIKRGGGVTHLVKFLASANPEILGYKKVILWGSLDLLSKIEDKPWLHKVHEPILDKSLIYRVFWHKFIVKKRAIHLKCDLLFLPGGTASSGFSPSVTMSRNMLPFEWAELLRFGCSYQTIKFILLRFIQINSFQKANGLIFLTRYAKEKISKIAKLDISKSTIISHGVDNSLPKKAIIRNFSSFDNKNPCRLIYVSHLSPYKHQPNLVKAVSRLREEGVPVSLLLIGPSESGVFILNKTINNVDPGGEFISYIGELDNEQINNNYLNSDICVFASSCENMPNILLEGMESGLPIVSSNMGPMPEILGEAGEYFDPLDVNDIFNALYKVIISSDLRKKMASSSLKRADLYTWEDCSSKTFSYLKDVAENTYTLPRV